jgi:hypothetical protein
MWGTFLPKLFADPIPLWVHVSLLLASFLATWAVGLGIISEHGSESVRNAANRLVIGGIVVEMVASVLLFAYDGLVSNFQQSEIKVTTERAARAEETLAAYRGQRELSAGQKDRIKGVTEKYPGISFIGVIDPVEEPWALMLEIGKFLRANGWNWQPWLPYPGLQSGPDVPWIGTTIVSHIQIDASPDQMHIAEALADAIRDPTLGMEDVRVEIKPEIKTMLIIIGSKK